MIFKMWMDYSDVTLTPHNGRCKTFGKIETASAIFWDYLGMFREYDQKNIFFRNKSFFVFQDRKLKLSESV